MPNAKPVNVLVVDDEPELRELLTDALTDDDVEVSSAASGREAIDIARRRHPDLIVADIRLGDCTGLEVIDHLRELAGDIPAVVITGLDDPDALNEAWRRDPVELMIKPLDVAKLQTTIRRELKRRSDHRRLRQRSRRLRSLARAANIERKTLARQLQTTCADLTTAYRSLCARVGLQQLAIDFQRELLTAKNDDDVFSTLFQMFAKRSGPVGGVALTCDADAELRIIGRFGVPMPDKLRFCQLLVQPVTDAAIVNPECVLIDAGEQQEMFDPAVRPYLAGVSILSMPLTPAEGEIIGLVVFYRKGEQPFTDNDVALAKMLAPSTAVAIRRND